MIIYVLIVGNINAMIKTIKRVRITYPGWKILEMESKIKLVEYQNIPVTTRLPTKPLTPNMKDFLR